MTVEATFGGKGWESRTTAHEDDVAADVVWTRCGYRSEVAPLRRVLVTRAPASMAAVADPNRSLMHGPIDFRRLEAELDEVAARFRALGIDVVVLDPPAEASPNIIFARDAMLVTPIGAVLGRMASTQRAGEERLLSLALAQVGIPIVRTISGAATFEGADALWIDEHTLVVATGFRTTPSAVDMLRSVLREIAVDVVAVPLLPGVQHLLGAFVPLDERLAVVRTDTIGRELRTLLAARGYTCIELPPSDDVVHARGMNVVVTRPGHVLMPAGAPSVRRALEAHGVKADEVDVTQSIKAAGGLGCLTGILHRAP